MGKRDQMVLQLVNQLGKISVADLAGHLDVAVETIRRDLTVLEKNGLLHRIHGFAVSNKINDLGSSFQRRQRANHDEKRSIAQNALEYVFEGAVIGLDASSSSWHFAQKIPDIKCTVVTNSMHNINALVNKPNITTIATGGVYSTKYDAFYGPLSEQLLKRLRIDIGIFSCVGIDDDGVVWESNEMNAAVKRKMMEACEQKFLLADYTKLARKNLIQLTELANMDILFINQLPNEKLQNYCRTHDVLITV